MTRESNFFDAGPSNLGVIESVAPQVLEHFLGFGTHLGGVHLGELLEGEAPTMETGSKSDGSVFRAYLMEEENREGGIAIRNP